MSVVVVLVTVAGSRGAIVMAAVPAAAAAAAAETAGIVARVHKRYAVLARPASESYNVGAHSAHS